MYLALVNWAMAGRSSLHLLGYFLDTAGST
ncbi:MAG: hypothetical protein K0R53_2452 [Burkholderiales bacterium]|jgi:hypothetical protein|nr:hypothetical protein [Burkholderiales bacterium]